MLREKEIYCLIHVLIFAFVCDMHAFSRDKICFLILSTTTISDLLLFTLRYSDRGEVEDMRTDVHLLVINEEFSSESE